MTMTEQPPFPHTKDSLKQLQSLPLESKIEMTKKRIESWYNYFDGEVYVSFSGGKDSTVLKYIVDSMYDDIPAVFVNTGLEYPETQRFVIDVKEGKYDCFNNDVEILYPEQNFYEVIKEYGYPIISKEVAQNVQYARKLGPDSVYYQKLFGTLQYNGKRSKFNTEKWFFLYDAPFKISNRCCDIMKKKPAHEYTKRTKKKPFVGTLAAESRLRESIWIKNGCNAYKAKDPKSTPLAFWKEDDILEFIIRNNVPYNKAYGKIKRDTYCVTCTGADRTGCIYCAFGSHLEKYETRFQRLAFTHPKQWEYCIKGGHFNEEGMWEPDENGLGLGFVLDYIGVPYEMREWRKGLLKKD